METITAQIFGFIGMAFMFASFQMNDKKKILLFQAITSTVFATHFALLGAFTGAVMNAVEIGRNLVFYREWEPKIKVFWIVLFIALFTVFGIASWQNFFSLLPILAMNLSTVAFRFDKPKYIRLCFLPVSVAWLIYNAVSFSVAGMITEIFDLLSLITAFLRFDLSKKKRKQCQTYSGQ